ncbi:MAG: response regulator transcription factor [Bacteroidota bacterium]|nr:response regulator transcription factor [Bacteroidota bacterium]
MIKKILVVDDEKDIVDLLKYNLTKEGYQVLTAYDGKRAIELSKHQPDLILLDIMLPEIDGFDVIKIIRKQKFTENLPVIFLTAKGSEVDEIVGLELGADDYIVKPVSIPKLLARIKLVLKRFEDKNISPREEIQIGAILINQTKHIVKVNNNEVFFPKKEFEVLLYLIQQAGRVVNRETLLNTIWGSDVYVLERTVDVHIRKIREKLGKYGDYIETIKGVGYRLKEIE